MTLELVSLFESQFDVNQYVSQVNMPALFGDIFDPKRDYQLENQENSRNTVNPQYDIPFIQEYGDLSRLHYLVRSRKVINVLEFGTGKSTVAIADALRKNGLQYSTLTKKSIRRSDQYKLFSVDNSRHWIKEVKKILPNNLSSYISFTYSKVIISEFQGRVASFYEKLPNVSPDLIYLDAPDQFHVHGNIRGITTAHSDRMPMSADILAIEHFLSPGTLIVVDGRTANARFLICNLQRNWSYLFDSINDQHYFELQEPPLGKHNRALLDHCLGPNYYKRVSI